MSKTDLTNQRQVFVEEYVRSGDHLEAAKKAGYKDTHTLRNQAFPLPKDLIKQLKTLSLQIKDGTYGKD
jgi:phage terminase small subunit